MAEVIDHVRSAAREQAQAYRQGEGRPLSGYVLVMAVFGALLAGAAGLARASGRRLPDLGPFDLLLMALGTHKLSRTLSKDAVTSPLRAPFTEYKQPGGPGEVMEDVRTTGEIRHAIGELITCPFCLDMWIATGFALGMVFAPRFSRMVAFTFAVVTGADFLQFAYAAAQQPRS
ncbi:MAG: hypothetical protein JWR88_2515 [Pseudonocardia sp.]|nr:hypothetical protein [Pseudonocardia sp.]